MPISRKISSSIAWLGVPVLMLGLAGCTKKTTAEKPEKAPSPPSSNAHIDLATSGAISGVVHFAGKAPTPIAIDMAQDPACDIAMKTTNYAKQYVIHDGKMANVFIYVKAGLGNRAYAPTKTPVVLDQKGCRFIPHVIGVMAGQPVEFRNSDPTLHNIHVPRLNAKNPAGFEFSQPPMSGSRQHVFTTPGLMIPIRCDYHPWMEALLNVVNNPFFAVSGTDGRFEIKGLPPGNYTLAAVQEKLGLQTQSVTVAQGKTTEANFTYSNK